jgi:hypothetical protein
MAHTSSGVGVLPGCHIPIKVFLLLANKKAFPLALKRAAKCFFITWL